MALLPVLITKESRIPRTVLMQPFVVGVKFGDKDELRRKMDAFMTALRDDGRGSSSFVRDNISRFLAEELDEDVALAKVCATMGLCRVAIPSDPQNHRLSHLRQQTPSPSATLSPSTTAVDIDAHRLHGEQD
jgi:hypothetical protein